MEVKQNNLLNNALFYHSLGWSIVPIKSKSKIPLIEWRQYKNQIASEKEIIKWWSKFLDANIGIVTGQVSKLIVVDIDPRNGGSDKEFKRTITVKSKTGGGGFHFYFQYEDGISCLTGIKLGIDIKADGGIVIAPPSLHESGVPYQWTMSPQAGTQIIALPDFIKDWIKNNKQKSDAKSNWDKNILAGVSEGTRNDSAASITGKLLHSFPKQEWGSVAWPLLLGWNRNNNPPLSEQELSIVFESIKKLEVENYDKSLTDKKSITNNNAKVDVKENGNGSYKNDIKFVLNESKLKAISKLKSYTSETHTKEIEVQLEIIFEGCESFPGHWHKVALYYNPRQIIWSLNYALKLHQKGRIKKNLAACFTNNIKYRHKRKD